MAAKSVAWVVVSAGLVASVGAQPASSVRPSRPAGTPSVQAGPATINPSTASVERFKSPVEQAKLREEALDLLMKASRDGDALARATTLEALQLAPGRLAEVVPMGLADPNLGVRSAAAMMVGRSKLKQFAAQVEPLLRDSDPRVRASAIYALDAIGVSVDPTPLAATLLSDPSPQARAHAAMIIGDMKYPSGIGLLRDAARQPMERVTQVEKRIFDIQLAEAMVKLGDNRQLEVLRAALYPARPEDLEVAALAVQSIGLVKDREAADNLIWLTSSRNEQGQPMPAEMRLAAAASLAMLGRPQGGFIADEFAGHASAALRAQSAFVYGEVGRAENLPKLEILMRDGESPVRVAAAAAVLKVTSQGSPNR